MQTKLFEVRDRATFIPVMATMMIPTDNRERYLLRRAGYGFEYPLVVVTMLNRVEETHYGPFRWDDGTRTMREAHKYIEGHFDELKSGEVIDVEYILGESNKKKASEQYDVY